MKKTIFTKKIAPFALILLFGTTIVNSTYGQNETSMLQKGDTSYFFKGKDSFKDALNAAANGDTIYLSAGSFNAPTAIDKGVVIIGAGHFPDIGFQKRTDVGYLNVNAGADNLHIEGLFANGGVTFLAEINAVKIIRCNVGYIALSAPANTTINDCIIKECFIQSGINLASNRQNTFGQNCQIIQNIILDGDYYCGNFYCWGASIYKLQNSIISRNIFFTCRAGDYKSFLSEVTNSVITNNIIVSATNTLLAGAENNNFEYNIFTEATVDFGITNTSNNNYMGISQNTIFVNQTGTNIDYNHDYHLQNPALYVDGNGVQIGLYGSNTPFKDKGYPFNPQIIEKNVGAEVLLDGTLPINIKVQAQDR
ncbi:MAG: hypothetical protein LBR55_01785 [Bacteroidales bacterium]|jgi:hypothetical protein|nr:hypothetical protein [Bacteroidales bacterium]